MAVISSFWWLWLLLVLVFGWLAIANHLRRIRGVMKGGMRGNFGSTTDAFASGIGHLVFYVGMTTCAGVLLIISVVMHLIAYAKP